jgi:hypothetical protein
MTSRLSNLGRTLVSKRSPISKREREVLASTPQDFQVTAPDWSTAFLLTSILCPTVGFILMAFTEASGAVTILAASGVLCYVAHWMVK